MSHTVTRLTGWMAGCSLNEELTRRSTLAWENDGALNLGLVWVSWLQSRLALWVSNLGQSPCAQKGSALGSMLCCHGLEIHTKVGARGPVFSFGTGPVYSSSRLKSQGSSLLPRVETKGSGRLQHRERYLTPGEGTGSGGRT